MQITYHSLTKIFLQRQLNQKMNLTAYLRNWNCEAEQRIFKKPSEQLGVNKENYKKWLMFNLGQGVIF